MRVITRRRLEEFWQQRRKYPHAQRPLERWHKLVAGAAWKTTGDVQAAFGGNVDFVEARRTKSTLFVFDAGGNRYRIVCAIHFIQKFPDKGRVYVMRVMDHAEYDDKKWLDEL